MKNSPGKAFTRQWYFRDWLADGELQMASASTRGIWMNLLCAMFDDSAKNRHSGEGKLHLNLDGIMRLGGATMEESERFLKEADMFGFCNIEYAPHELQTNASNAYSATEKKNAHGNFTIISRRIHREAEKRARWRNRKQKQKNQDAEKTSSRQIPTQFSESSNCSISSSSSTSKYKDPKNGPHARVFFDKNLIEKIDLKCEKRGSRFSAKKFVLYHLRRNGHPQAIEEALNSINMHFATIDNYWAWGSKIINRKSGNYHEQDSATESENYKKDLETFINEISG